MGKCCLNLGQNPTGEIMITSGRKMLSVCLLGMVAENRVLHHDHGYALCFKALPMFPARLFSTPFRLSFPPG
jgi:hypothetical protein